MAEEGAQRTVVEPRLCARVARTRGEQARVWLLGQELLDRHGRVAMEGPTVLLPLSERAVPGAATPRESAEGCGARDDGTVDAGGLGPMAQNFATHFGASFVVREVEVRSRDRGAYQQVADVPEQARPLLPQSFDHIGDIAVVKFDERNEAFEEPVARAILASYKGIRLVAADEGVKGPMRVRTIRKVAGQGGLDTVHKEFGIAVEVDLAQTFFTPRLAGERRRVALAVAPHERVLDAFAGVGPFSLHIAKVQPTVEVDAVDLNPRAVELLRRNGERNKLRNIRAHEADFKAFAAQAKPRSYSRVVMNLPHRAREFLPSALPLVALGGTIHLYAILPLEQILPEQGQLGEIAREAGARLTVLRARPVKSYSPVELFVAFDLRVDPPAGTAPGAR